MTILPGGPGPSAGQLEDRDEDMMPEKVSVTEPSYLLTKTVTVNQKQLNEYFEADPSNTSPYSDSEIEEYEQGTGLWMVWGSDDPADEEVAKLAEAHNLTDEIEVSY